MCLHTSHKSNKLFLFKITNAITKDNSYTLHCIEPYYVFIYNLLHTRVTDVYLRYCNKVNIKFYSNVCNEINTN